MRQLRKICFGLLFIIAIPVFCSAQNQGNSPVLFQGRINARGINVRSDSTVSAKIICTLNKGEIVEVTKELYDWYKIRLPRNAPAFINKNMVSIVRPLDEKTAKVIKDNVNIRLEADESSAILGRVDNLEVVNIIRDKGEWYKIEPPNSTFGWIHKKFVDKLGTADKIAQIQLTQETKIEDKTIADELPQGAGITLEGIIKPYGKFFKRKATHKLIAPDNKLYLLKGNKSALDTLNHRKVRVAGQVIPVPRQKYPLIEVLKIEALD